MAYELGVSVLLVCGMFVCGAALLAIWAIFLFAQEIIKKRIS